MASPTSFPVPPPLPTTAITAATAATTTTTSHMDDESQRRYLSEEPTDQDVLCRRGTLNKKHPGNMAFQQLILDHSTAYAAATGRNVKGKIGDHVLQQVHTMLGARFLKKDDDTNQWYEINRTDALTITKQRLYKAIRKNNNRSTNSKHDVNRTAGRSYSPSTTDVTRINDDDYDPTAATAPTAKKPPPTSSVVVVEQEENSSNEDDAVMDGRTKKKQKLDTTNSGSNKDSAVASASAASTVARTDLIVAVGLARAEIAMEEHNKKNNKQRNHNSLPIKKSKVSSTAALSISIPFDHNHDNDNKNNESVQLETNNNKNNDSVQSQTNEKNNNKEKSVPPYIRFDIAARPGVGPYSDLMRQAQCERGATTISPSAVPAKKGGLTPTEEETWQSIRTEVRTIIKTATPIKMTKLLIATPEVNAGTYVIPCDFENRFQARLYVFGKTRNIGTFSNEQEANLAYRIALNTIKLSTSYTEQEQKRKAEKKVAKVKQAERERIPKVKKLLADNPLCTIEKTPAQRLVSWRQLTPKQTTELLVVLRKISKDNAFESKDTTSRAVKYLLSAIHHGLMHYPDTCDPKVVQWNGVSKFCINSHIPLLIALFMAKRNDDDHQFSIEEWDEIHTEVMYGCQNAIDRKKKKEKGCNSNPLTGSTIEKSGEVDKDGKLVWKRIDARLKLHNNANIRNTGLQFTGGGTGSAYITRTVTGVSIVWPEFKNTITVQAIQELGKSLMNHLSITDHCVVGKLLEMRHWHSMNYFGHRPVGIYWLHKDGGTLSSMTKDEMELVASKGAQWIKSTSRYK